MFAGSMMSGGMSAGLVRGLLGQVGSSLVAAGNNQATAYAMERATLQAFLTVASGAGVIIPAGMNPGEEFKIFNGGANALLVYPPTGGTISGGAVNAPTSVAVNATISIAAVDLLTFVVSAGTGGGPPGGADTNVQYNNAGTFGGDSGLTYTVGTKTLNLVGSANTLSLAGAATTAPVTLVTTGTDANIDVQVEPKGTGALRIKKTEGVYVQYVNAANAVVAHVKILGSADEGSLGIGVDTLAAANANIGNIAIGASALEAVTSGVGNIGIGKLALNAITTSGTNTAVGYQSLRAATSASNTAVGANALEFTTSGAFNTAIGSGAGNGNSTGQKNTWVGRGAGFTANATENTAVGDGALPAATGDGNLALGINALLGTLGGSYNIGMGWEAGKFITTGVENIAIGLSSMATVTTGTRNIAIGYLANVAGAAFTKSIAIGASASAGASNVAVIGASGGSNEVNVGINMTTPTARIHLPAGTATASTAPLKFTSGTNLTAAEAGAMEYNGTNLFFTRAAAREGVLTQSAVTTEVLVTDTTVTVNIGGVTYKLLARA